MAGELEVRSRAIGLDRRRDFSSLGRKESRFFPHTTLYLPKAGPDGFKLAERMCGMADPAAFWEIVLYAEPETIAEFPRELFFDRELVWHEQHFGVAGQIATANVAVTGSEAWSMVHISDLVQRIGRRREHKTRIENRFRGWHDLLLNALLAFAVERGLDRVHVPTAELALEHTDPRRNVGLELFERIYDRDVTRLFEATSTGGWWTLDVAANRNRLVFPTVHRSALPAGRVVALAHDIERGLGHVDVDPERARKANREARRSLTGMLRVERKLGARATYSVVGALLPDVRQEIEEDGHCVAFHSYDHVAEGPAEQLPRCRELDYRIKGYRPPRSRLTPELTDERLLFHNFEWLALSARRLGLTEPRLEHSIVRIPVHVDDFPLYRERLDPEDWWAAVVATVAANDVTVVSLHDCYADLWLRHYPRFVAELRELAELRTLDELAASATLAAAA